MLKKSVINGLAASATLLLVYFTVLTLVSGQKYAFEQFSFYWYFIVTLALGFGTQITLYSYLRRSIHAAANGGAKSVLAVSGTTSTASMISCCVHYLANLLPVIASAGVVSFVIQYQPQLFGLGIGFNFLGIMFITNKIINFKQIRHMKVLINVSLVLAAVVLTGFLVYGFPFRGKVASQSSLSPQTVSGQAEEADQPAAQIDWPVLTNDEGTVSISVKPQNMSPSEEIWSFEVSLDTHSGDLGDDLTKAVQLFDGTSSHNANGWEGDPPGGHHRSGVLKFKRVSPQPSSIALKITLSGDLAPRILKWGL